MSITFNIENATPQDGEALCKSCLWVHMQKGFRESEEAVFCNYGPLRQVRFKVRECTDYSNKTLPSRDEMEKMALLINVEPARKKAGFKVVAGPAGLTSEEAGDEEAVAVAE
jgi:hypothetical protein